MDAIGGYALFRMLGSVANGFIAGMATKVMGGSSQDAIWTGVTTTTATFVGTGIPDFTGSTALVVICNFITGFYIGGATESIASVARAGERIAQDASSGKTLPSSKLGYIGLTTRIGASYRGTLIL